MPKSNSMSEVTQFMAELEEDLRDAEALLSLVYQELHQLAQQKLAQENHRLSPGNAWNFSSLCARQCSTLIKRALSFGG
jgi:hypothetical protein